MNSTLLRARDLVIDFNAEVGSIPSVQGIRYDAIPLASATNPVPLTGVGVAGLGRTWSDRRYIDSVVGASAEVETVDASSDQVSIVAIDKAHAVRVVSTWNAIPGASAVRVSTAVTNVGPETIEVEWVSSLALEGLLPLSPLEKQQLWWARNDWLAENRWQSDALRDILPDLNRQGNSHDPRGVFEVEARGTCSTDGFLPVGVLEAEGGGAIGWQVEVTGPWHWQVGERSGAPFVSALGPADVPHQWSVRLAPGETFNAVPALLVGSNAGAQGVFGEFTAARRAMSTEHPVDAALPVVFNDYMNTLMGDPTSEKLAPLIAAAADVGAEVFCIDAGWYAEIGEDWWSTVGSWEPSNSRFPDGLPAVIAQITGTGMRPGLWLEPEFVGTRSEIVERLPADAFFSRRGRRVTESNRYQLDLRHPAVREHLDAVFDRLIGELGIQYFKLDHNMNTGAGTDLGGKAPGAGLLEYSRAHHEWLDALLARHPHVIIENCSSGGMRTDSGLLGRLHLQSTSDQQDAKRYPPIAAAAAAIMRPEQALSWAYPQPEFDDDEIVFTTSIPQLGRFQLSGFIDGMAESQLDLVKQSIAAYKGNRGVIAQSLPVWPLGLPGWDDEWISHGLYHGSSASALYTVWRRSGGSPNATLKTPEGTRAVAVEPVFPREFVGRAEVVDGDVVVSLQPWQAVTLKVTVEQL